MRTPQPALSDGSSFNDLDTFPVDPPQIERTMAVIARLMPWVLSLLMHVGLFLAMLFVVFVVLPDRDKPLALPGEAYTPVEVPAMHADRPSDSTRAASPRAQRKPMLSRSPKPLAVNSQATSRNLTDIISPLGAGSSGGGEFGRSVSGGVEFVGLSADPPGGKPARNVVYVVDRSGSMIDTFDAVRLELLRSVGRLREDQTFHVILFAEDRPLENPPRRLVRAERSAKRDVARFLADVTPEGQTDPLPAVERAMEVLGGSRGGSVVYLLTDAAFPQPDAVVQSIRQKTQRLPVSIYTLLYGSRPPEAEQTMRRIAEMTRGRFRYVPAR